MIVPIHTVILGSHQLVVEQIVSGLRQAGFTPDWMLLDSEAACAEYLGQRHDKVDVILVDASVQDIDPGRVGHLVHTRWRDIPVVVVAGSPSDELRSDYAEQGIADVLPASDLRRIGAILIDAQRRRPHSGGRMLAAFDVLASLVERLPVGVAVVGLDGAIQYLNRSLSLLTGYASDVDVRMTVDRLLTGRPNSDLWRQIVDSVTESGEWQADVHGRRQTGEAYQAVVMVTPIQAAAGAPTGYLVMGHDITEQTRMLNALRASEQRFQALIQASPLAIVAHDQEGRISIWNPAAERIFGWQADEATGRMYVDLTVPSPARKEHFGLRDRALQGESIAGVEARRWKKDGTLIDVSLSTAALRDARDAIVGVMAVIADVTEHKRAVNRLRQSEERFRRLIEHAMDLIWVLDAGTGAILYGSPSTARILGYAHEDLIGQDIFTYVHPEDQPSTREVFDALLEHPRLPMRADARVRRSDGAWAHLEAIGRYAPELGGVVVNAWDITDRKQAEDAVRALNADLERRVADRTRDLAGANARLQELDRLKSKFVSDVSHDLRTPLATLQLHLGLLERGEPEKRGSHVAALRAQVHQLIDLVEDILDLSRLEREEETAEFEAVDLNAVAERVVTANQARAKAAGLDLVFQPEANLPPVQGVHDLLSRLVANLTTNAIHYTSAGHVQVRTFREDGYVRLQVSDTGIGIDPDELPHVFERFYRGRRARKSDVPGTGLGLGIVREIAELHGGSVRVESTVGEGSAFTVEFPCEAETDAPSAG
jgi:PAS domain S-box-containing protein